MSEAASAIKTSAAGPQTSPEEPREAARPSSAPPPVAMDVRGLSKRFLLTGAASKEGGLFQRIKGKEFWAVKNVSFTLRRGERLGLIGRNGAGKSTLLKLLSRVLVPTEGEADIFGRATSLLEVGTGFNPDLTGLQNIHLNAALHGLTREEIDARLDEIVDFSEVGRFIHEQVKFYSSGMRSRLGFAVAAHLDPDILMLDEVLAVGDMAFQRKCLHRMKELTGEGRTLIFVTHGMESVARFCNRCIWLHEGSIRADGPVEDVTAAYVDAAGVTARVERKREEEAETPAKPKPVSEAEGDAELISASVVDAEMEQKSILGLDQKVGIRYKFKVYKKALYVPSIALYDPDDQLLFWAIPGTNSADAHRLDEGEYEAVVWLPSHFLNIGRYSVTLAVVGPDHSPMERYIFSVKGLSFHMVEPPYEVESARGVMPRKFPGGLRPVLDWSFAPTNETNAQESTEQ